MFVHHECYNWCCVQSAFFHLQLLDDSENKVITVTIDTQISNRNHPRATNARSESAVVIRCTTCNEEVCRAGFRCILLSKVGHGRAVSDPGVEGLKFFSVIRHLHSIGQSVSVPLEHASTDPTSIRSSVNSADELFGFR